MVLFSSASTFAYRTVEIDGQFDTALLRVEEGRYLGKTVPDVKIVTEFGEKLLSAVAGDKPTIVVLAYFTCGHTCPITLQNLVQMQIDAPHSDYNVVVLSFDEKDSLMTMAHVKSTIDRIPENWTFGLLQDGESGRLTSSVGFKFFFSEQDQNFVHPAVLVFLSPEREVMRYLYGAETRGEDVELALIESRNRAPRLNEIVEMVKLTCFQFDKSRSRYSLHPTLIFGAAGVGILGLVGLAALVTKRDLTGGI